MILNMWFIAKNAGLEHLSNEETTKHFPPRISHQASPAFSVSKIWFLTQWGFVAAVHHSPNLAPVGIPLWTSKMGWCQPIVSTRIRQKPYINMSIHQMAKICENIHETSWNISKCKWNIIKYVNIYMKYHDICQNMHETSWNMSKYTWNIMSYVKISMKYHETINQTTWMFTQTTCGGPSACCPVALFGWGVFVPTSADL